MLCFRRRRTTIIYTDNLAHKFQVGCTDLRIKIIAIKVKKTIIIFRPAGDICPIMKFRIFFRDFRCSTAKKLKKIQSIKEKEIMGLEEKKRG
jgi:hypothetical protein